MSWKFGFVNTMEAPRSRCGGVDRLLSLSDAADQLHVENGVLYDGRAVLGAHVVVKDGETQNIGIAHMGTVDWILVECETWSMIPLENLIAHRGGSHTKIAAIINTPLEAQGAGFALEQGVDALVVANEASVLEAALSVKAQRLERMRGQHRRQNTGFKQPRTHPTDRAIR